MTWQIIGLSYGIKYAGYWKEMIVHFQTVEEGITKDMETCKMDFEFNYHL